MVSDVETLPPKDIATAFYQRYEPKEVLGKGVSSTVREEHVAFFNGLVLGCHRPDFLALFAKVLYFHEFWRVSVCIDRFFNLSFLYTLKNRKRLL